jgi:mono/diheme cytochrome c family protein
MRRTLVLLGVLALGWIVVPLDAQESSSVNTSVAFMGGGTFKTYCSSCHGPSAHGDGPLAQHLRFAPPDLTRIAKRNNGKFDVELVAKIIDGRQPVKGHGGSDMPVWGDAFSQSREGYSQDKVKQKILELAQYLGTLQE